MIENFFEKRGLYYRTNGFDPEKKTLVFIHGLSGSSSAWIKYEEKFASEFNILSLDLRGHGKSKKPASIKEYELDNFVSDLYELLDYLNIKKIILISHSFGSLVAFDFILKHQDIVLRAVLLSPNFSIRKRLAAKIMQPFFELSHLFRFFPFSGKPKKHLDYSEYLNTGDWNLKRMFADVKNTSLRVYLFISKISYSFDRGHLLEKIRIPVLLIHGEKDTIFPVSASKTMEQKMGDARLVLIENADHILVLNHFPEVSRVIENFIK